jgi:hypothetical protein
MMQNIPKDKILEVVKEGPTIPAKIVKRVGGDTMLVGAILSTMISNGDICYSNIKIGGSPLYYVKGDEEKLEQFTDHLNEKDRRTFNILKEKKVLQDTTQDPLVRVSLKTIKDFAKQFDYEGKLFWRFYSVDKDEAMKIAEEIFRKDIPKHIENTQYEKSEYKAQVEHSEKVDKKEEVDKKENNQQNIKPILVEENRSVSQKIIIENKIIEPKTYKSEKHVKSDEDIEKKDFFESIRIHIHNKGLDIVGKEKIKKSEYDLVLKNHDTNEYIFCKAKDKKTINEGDLSTAFVYAHNKKMPCMFLTTGSLTKKAETMIQKEFKDMVIEKIE